MIATKSTNHLGGYTDKEFKLDFAGKTESIITRHKRSPTDGDLKVKERFIYDDQKRLLKHYHTTENYQEELLAENTYNELGQLANKKTGNTSGTPLQSVNYGYNIRGWLTNVNDPSNLPGQLFGYELKYQNPGLSQYAKFNGNISEITWRTMGTDDALKRYTYSYDVLNRMRAAYYQEPNATAPFNKLYNEELDYDLNGNIINLKRNTKGQNLTPLYIDNLEYIYQGNRMVSVKDKTGNPSGYIGGGNAITYDLNGNMTNHLDKGITAISYNFLNLPNEVKFPDLKNRLMFIYRADGVKQKKLYRFFNAQGGITVRNTDYLDGFQYDQEGNSITLQFFPTSEGYYDYQKKRYVYNYEDHVGNIRLAYYWDTVTQDVAIDREANYYPFGLEYEGFNTTQLPSYRYGYNGKELQKETGWNDYGARMYMADLGRWGVVDPLAEISRRWGTYTYAYSNPIRFIDPDGMQNYDVIMSGDLKDKAFEQLQAKSGNLDLQMNSKGKVTGSIKSGATATAAELKLLEATVDSSVMVNLDATSANSIDNTPLFGGAFGGSEIDDNGIVQTNQIMNPNQAEIIENAIGRPKGGTVLHEILESYIAGKNNPGAPGFGIGGDLSEKPYLDAHNAANKLDPSHKNYTISQTTDSVDVIIGGTKFGTVTSYINVTKTTPLIKSNGEPHRRKTVTSVTKVPVATAKDVRIRN
ncbi:RHS repeat domain-containing protein [Chryseobacterium sp. JM1]|uniref:RHS repeat domain-containing protein n=1 Tax=Chryseobacterium sp. JM1 TaxID=1233950 RepID=UPI000690CEF6|nr:RHS repeat-associated core domain-containing protein [Chryseobacterium sp. JM1]